ncbi:hypothetical protein BJY52DRAFT_212138 [Lactarius psammicola]|nr:hypothetical protein BJY52DRAFT_212138 [Lactarius psammicola]
MSQMPPIASSSSNFQAIFDASLKAYEKKTKRDLLTHPLMAQLQACDSPTDILDVLHTQVQQFEQSTRDDDKLTRWLNPTVNVLYAFSTALGEGVGLVFSPAKVIFAGAGVLLLVAIVLDHPYTDCSDTKSTQAAKDVVPSQDALVDIFERIENFFRRLETYIEVPMTEAMRHIIVKIMVELIEIFGIVTKEVKLGRAMKYLKKLVGRRDIEDALRRLDRLTQQEVQMAIVEVLKVTHHVKDGVETVGDKVNLAIEDGKVVKVVTMETKALVQQTADNIDEDRRSRVRKDHQAWLSPPDPSTNQNIACSAQHDGTATWFFQGSIFMEWKFKSTTSLLWIHGKPGSGKSILCSAIIQNIMVSREAGLASMAYFYFDSGDTNKQGLRGLLASLLTQLSARSDSCCDILSHVYKAHDDGAHMPSTRMLIACLKEMLALRGQGPIYIILDALDECPNTSGIPPARKQVLDLLKDLVGLQLLNLHICVTSRPEAGIQVALQPLGFYPVSIHDQSGQKEDIEYYIRSVVYADSDTAMGRWRDNDKELVIETLTERADGMFRWVFCQLEVLQHCPPQSIRQTLNELPKSLDETYKRVLKEIGMANRDRAHHLLQYFAGATRPWSVEGQAENLALDFDGPEHQRAVSPPSTMLQYANASTSSLSAASPSNPMHREAVRAATSVLCKEMLRHGQSASLGGREAEEVECRLRALARLERVWGRSGAAPNGSTTQLGGMSSSTNMAGEERERRMFIEALRDGYVLCQLMNKLRPGSIARIDPREDGKLRTSNVTKFLASCSANGLPPDDLFLRDDLIEGTSDCLARVAKTIIALVKWAETPVPTHSHLLRGGDSRLRPINKPLPNVDTSTYPTLLNAGSGLGRSGSGSGPVREVWQDTHRHDRGDVVHPIRVA